MDFQWIPREFRICQNNRRAASLRRQRETRRFAMSMHFREELSMRGKLKKTSVPNIAFLRHFRDTGGQVDAPVLRQLSRTLSQVKTCAQFMEISECARSSEGR
jgi:hypothetical protein